MSIFKKLPSGAITDIAYLSLVVAIFKIAGDDRTAQHNDVVVIDTDYHTRKKIDRNIAKIIKKANELFASLSYSDLARVRKRQAKLFNHFLLVAPKIVQLDSYALWLLYERFKERDKPLIPQLQWLQEINYDYLSDLIDKNNPYEQQMYDTATHLARLL